MQVALSEWLVLGFALGVLVSVCVAGIFAVGVRMFPTRTRAAATIVDGDARRRREIREYLRAIGEAFAEDYPVEGQEVAFYLPSRDVAITFDARAFYRIDHSPTDAVLVEHEMPGVNLGYRLPFDTPEPRFGEGRHDDRLADPRETAFSVLGLPAGATRREVKRAYRRKLKDVHPDHGGETEEFKRVREAYTTARKNAT